MPRIMRCFISKSAFALEILSALPYWTLAEAVPLIAGSLILPLVRKAKCVLVGCA